VVLSNTIDPLDTNREKITFFVDASPSGGKVIVTEKAPSAYKGFKDAKEEEHLAHLSKFSAGLDSGEFLDYSIELNATKEIAMIKHHGFSSYYNTNKVKCTLKHIPQRMRYVSISVWKKPVCFENFVIAENPLPDDNPSNKGVTNPKNKNNNNNTSSTSSTSSTSFGGFVGVVTNAIGNLWSPPSPDECPDNLRCTKVLDPVHMKDLKHSFNKMCKDFEKCLLRFSDEGHNKKFCHPCKFGMGCRERNDDNHCKRDVHIERESCKLGRGCSEMTNPQHRETFHHPGYPDFLIPCRHALKCHQAEKPDHLIKYKHS